ncbi:MAG: molybdopterin-dependent oxidoreductase [Cyanobacteria bacterium NC_groundwater_1444_Ag_S-0.65um_54_12]|nr:molybdopterin-dependent oxidoreductase [Cyanobacteria bacterium NC_groundwater_1444_Ag_S-0.65um_54_12]
MYIFDEKLGRRKFLQGAGATVAAATGMAASLTGCATMGSRARGLAVNDEGIKQWGREAGEWIASCCNMCGGQSGILAQVVDGKVVKIEPNHWNPNNYGNVSTDFFDGYTVDYGCKEGGAICPKGNSGIQQLYDPDRVKKPLKRTNPDRSIGADPKWEEISWEQALDEIAAKLKTMRDAGEAHKLLWFSEDHSFTHIQGDFMELYGSPNYSNHSNVCDVARKASFKMVMGDERPLADFLNSKYILLFGWNPTSAIKWVHLPRIITRAIERGARMVVVDPYMSDTATKAQEWVPIRPATDGALALAMAHVIIGESLYDKDFVTNWTVGFAEYAAFVKDKTPQWAEEITSIPAKTIVRLARELATTKPAIVDVWSGPGQHSNGVQGGRAIAMLAALVGGMDRPGTMLMPNKKGNKHIHINAEASAEHTLEQPRFDELKRYPISHKSGVYTQSFVNLAEGKGPYQPKMAMIVFQNLMMSLPGTETIVKALAKLETVVVIDTMLSETAMMADYVLPGTTYLERYDLNNHWVTWPVLALRQPVVKPLFGQPAEYEVVAALGRRLGLKTHEGQEYFKIGAVSGQPIEDLTRWYEEVLSKELLEGEPKISLADLKKLPGAVWIDQKGTKYEKYASELKPEKLKDAFFDGAPTAEGTPILDKPKDKKGKRIGTVFGGKPVRGFFTKSGKVEFVSVELAEKKDANGKPVDPLPAYESREWLPTPEYPFYLINWKEATHTHTRTQNNAYLAELKGDNPLAIHPDAAEKLGLADGDSVKLESPYGAVVGKVKITRRIHPEVVGFQHGFGHTAMGRIAKGKGTSDAVLRPTKSDPLSGQALHKENCVRISKA